jgi:hypothetical protein
MCYLCDCNVETDDVLHDMYQKTCTIYSGPILLLCSGSLSSFGLDLYMEVLLHLSKFSLNHNPSWSNSLCINTWMKCFHPIYEISLTHTMCKKNYFFASTLSNDSTLEKILIFYLCVKLSHKCEKCLLIYPSLSFIILSYDLTLISKVIDG